MVCFVVAFHSWLFAEDMPTNEVEMHPSDGAKWLSTIHDHFESGNGSAEALAKAHQRMSAFGVQFASAGSSMTVTNMTEGIRNHMRKNDCGCEDEPKKSKMGKGCSGSERRQRYMRHPKKKNALDMTELSQAMVATDQVK